MMQTKKNKSQQQQSWIKPQHTVADSTFFFSNSGTVTTCTAATTMASMLQPSLQKHEHLMWEFIEAETCEEFCTLLW